jgi:hypothetical protein
MPWRTLCIYAGDQYDKDVECTAAKAQGLFAFRQQPLYVRKDSLRFLPFYSALLRQVHYRVATQLDESEFP